MQNRNYLYANDIYLRLAIGNAPWPIGVTSVGIHERASREKISHVMNVHGQAHIMNDEATRKFLQVGRGGAGMGIAWRSAGAMKRKKRKDYASNESTASIQKAYRGHA